MRSRLISSPSFTGDKVLGAILFENTMNRQVEGIPTATYLWEKKSIVPFLKCDNGLAAEENGVQLMKPMPDLDELLKRAKEKGIYGTKMRSLIKTSNPEGIKALVAQQFEVGKQIIAAGLVPIIEPEVDITSPTKSECEDLLNTSLLEHLNKLGENEKVMIKVSLPSTVNQYKECIDHPNCIRVVALSGGYSREEANELLSTQTGMIASFSRALSEGLQYEMTDEEFHKTLLESVASIYEASKSNHLRGSMSMYL
jgi:fructose-bisphosphate aldolase class I